MIKLKNLNMQKKAKTNVNKYNLWMDISSNLQIVSIERKKTIKIKHHIPEK